MGRLWAGARQRSLVGWAALAVGASACGCILGSGPLHSPEAGAAGSGGSGSGARVQATWQQRLSTQLATNQPPVDEAWGLFSEGGWADAGQVLAFAAKDRSTTRLLVVDPARKEVGTDRALSRDETDALAAAATAADGLSDLDIASFDGVVYEFVHAVKDKSGTVSIAKRLSIRNPGAKPQPPYDALLAAFQKLRPKPGKR